MSICDDARAKGISIIQDGYQPLINEFLKIIGNMTNKQLDPKKYYDAVKDQVIDIPFLVADLEKAKQEQVNELNDKVDRDCEQTMTFLQTIVDLAVAKYSKGLSVILPKHITHIDVAEILSGKPLGGDNSVLNQIKNEVFDGIGIGENNDLRKTLNNPVPAAKDAVNKVLEDWGVPVRI